MGDGDLAAVLERAQHLVCANAALGLDRREVVVDGLPGVEVGDTVAHERDCICMRCPPQERLPGCKSSGLRRSAQASAM